MSGSVRNYIHKKQFVDVANNWLNQNSVQKNVEKMRTSVQSLVRTLSPSRCSDTLPHAASNENVYHAKKDIMCDSKVENQNSTLIPASIREVESTVEHACSDYPEHTSLGTKGNINASSSTDVKLDINPTNTDIAEDSYYSSYILPVVNRFYGKWPTLTSVDTSTKSNKLNNAVSEDKIMKEIESICDYEQFDDALRKASAAQLVDEVLDNSKESSHKQLVDSIGMRLKDLTKPTNNVSTVSQPKFTCKAAIDTRTRGLCIAFKSAKSSASKLIRLEELCQHLRQYPHTTNTANKQNITNMVLKISIETKDKALQSVCHEMLAHVGHVSPVKRKGISILAIDGGGSRGVISVELLRELERQTCQRIPDLFDYIVGTSTGALVAILLSVFRVSIDDCERLYKELSQRVFARSFWGTGRLVWNHAYYDSDVLETLYRSNMGEKYVMESARDKKCPKLSVVATGVNAARLSPYLFRNYRLPARVQSHYHGTSDYKFWQCLMASCAAPGYFQDYKLGGVILQDGGMLTNNPTAVGLHEAMLLWPGVDLQCVVSVGNGRYENTVSPGSGGPHSDGDHISLRAKLNKIVDSATDTEKVHTVLHDLLPPNTYYRLNPYMSEDITLDEQRTDKLEQLQADAHLYIRQNEYKFKLLSQQLLLQKPRHTEWLERVQMALRTRNV